MTNYLKQAARLKGHKNIKGWRTKLEIVTETNSSQKRSFSRKASLSTLPNIWYLPSVGIWASKFSFILNFNLFFFSINWQPSIVFSPKCGDPNDNSTEALATKVFKKGIILPSDVFNLRIFWYSLNLLFENIFRQKNFNTSSPTTHFWWTVQTPSTR